MKTLVYIAMLVGVLILLRQSIMRRKTKNKTDSVIDIVAYSLMAVGLVMLVVACIYEAVTGHSVSF